MKFMSLPKPALSQQRFLLLFSCYIGIFLNIAFYRQVLAIYPLNSLHQVLVFLSMPLVALCVINGVTTLFAFVGLERVVLSLLILVSAAAHYFIQNYGIVIDRSMIVNIADTTAAEAFALMSPRFFAWFAAAGILMSVLVFRVRILKSTPLWKRMLNRGLSLLFSVVIIVIVALLFYKDYASLFRNNKGIIKTLNPSNSIAALWSYYSHYRMTNQPFIRIGLDARQDPQRGGGTKKNLTILIVGETSRADNFSLSGYNRLTNPRLAQDNVVFFPHTLSCGTSTAVSVPCMFSGMPRAHYDESRASHQEGLLDIIQRAGIQVLWHENDGGCKSVCDRVPHQDMTALKLPGMCINGECYDDVLFQGLEEYIRQLHGNGIIVLHTIGSHGPTYYHRYPSQFRKFLPECDTNEIQSCSETELTNTYDNSILYVDYIVDKAIKLLQAHQADFTTSLVYLSDHGESLGEKGIYLHGMPYAIAPDQQKHVPMLVWLSDEYQKRYSVNTSCLTRLAASDVFSQDNLFSTLLGLTGTLTREYRPDMDILTMCRNRKR